MFSGCLPLLLPMPILFALFFVFQSTIEFRGVSFMWLADISQKDPFYILPLVMGFRCSCCPGSEVATHRRIHRRR
jgi:YidC/Oxa1 family membrane protein insertase